VSGARTTIRRTCMYCKGECRTVHGLPCMDCNGDGVVCYLCDKPKGVCECVEDEAVRVCPRCNKMPAACECL